ncbi:MAG TPA: hypothetical protein VM095_01245 [Pyrinomonadaceae bacterium]|nr:hypothetical protein [Pyrinomonadaceae bacterium]
MVTLLITSFLLLAGITYVVYLWQRPSSQDESGFTLPSPRAASLFDDDGLSNPPPRELAAGEAAKAEQRDALFARAEAGDKEALPEAHATRDPALYDEVLNKLIEQADSDKSLLALASYISRSDAPLRINRALAEKFIVSWQKAPDRNSTAKMLHVAARANDAGLYQTAIEMSYQFWRARKLPGIHADELRQLIESEFWILAPEVRNSGAGFVLKRKLAHLRRQLVAAKQSDE